MQRQTWWFEHTVRIYTGLVSMWIASWSRMAFNQTRSIRKEEDGSEPHILCTWLSSRMTPTFARSFWRSEQILSWKIQYLGISCLRLLQEEHGPNCDWGLWTACEVPNLAAPSSFGEAQVAVQPTTSRIREILCRSWAGPVGTGS